MQRSRAGYRFLVAVVAALALPAPALEATFGRAAGSSNRLSNL